MSKIRLLRPGSRPGHENGSRHLQVLAIAISFLVVPSSVGAVASEEKAGPPASAETAKASAKGVSQKNLKKRAHAEPAVTEPPPPAALLAERRKRFARIDALSERGLSTKNPIPSDSVFGDIGGIRSALADHGIGIIGLSSNTFYSDLMSPNRKGPQAYSGEKPTFQSINQVIV